MARRPGRAATEAPRHPFSVDPGHRLGTCPQLGGTADRSVANRPGGDNEPVTAFGEAVKRLRENAGIKQQDLAARIYISPSTLNKLESGKRNPSIETARLLDDALNAGGELVALTPANAADLLLHADKQTQQLLNLFCGPDSTGQIVSNLGARTEELACQYLAIEGPQLITDVKMVRTRAMTLMRRLRKPEQLRDTVAFTGYLSGILAYAALDAGSPKSALDNARAAWAAAEAAGSDQLRAWVRGTQSLIMRFESDYDAALNLATDGLRYQATGTAPARLLCGVGQCHANRGNAHAARRALNDAADAHAAAHGHDEMPGVFGFSEAKLAYYSGSSLIWLAGGADARRARDQAHTAISLWKKAGVERSVADEALAHVYAATASLQLRDLEAAATDLEPILGLPPERRISWIKKRMDRIVEMLSQPPYDTDPLAIELCERIREYR